MKTVQFVSGYYTLATGMSCRNGQYRGSVGSIQDCIDSCNAAPAIVYGTNLHCYCLHSTSKDGHVCESMFEDSKYSVFISK